MTNNTIKTAILFALFSFGFLIHGCAVAKPVSYYQSVSDNSVGTGSVSPEVLEEWVASGHLAFENGQYETARDFYYRAMMADSNREDILVSYGACLTNLGFYENAVQIYNIALSIDPYDNVAQSNLALTRQLMAARTEQERVAALQQQQQQNSISDLVASLNSLASSLQQQQQGAAQITQTAPSSSASTVDPSRWTISYERFGRQVDSNLRTLSFITSTSVRYQAALRTLRANQRDMRNIRLEAARNGVIIRVDPRENANP